MREPARDRKGCGRVFFWGGLSVFIALACVLCYAYLMTLTVEIIDHGAIKLLNDLESLGLIHVKPAVPQDGENATAGDDRHSSFLRLRGIHKDAPGASVEDFLARCREDKAHELAIEKRQEEERVRLAGAKLPS